jgi:anaerobic magnesium-protoporphyrin IX monomethyl ester cyclase
MPEISKQPPLCFIIPPSPFLLDERVFPSLGVLRVAAVCERAGHPVDVLDLSGIENYADALEAYLSTARASCFGVSATTPQMPAAAMILRTIRRLRPDARTILGGPHVTLVHAALREEEARGAWGKTAVALETIRELADVAVAGDGEEAIFLALDADAPPSIDADVPNSPLFLSGKRLDDLPFPARHLIDLDSYRYWIDGNRATSIIAQLGCPFGCSFCGGRSSPSLRRVRLRSTASILEEIESIHRTYGHRGFMFFDDELNVNRRMVELMEGIATLAGRLGTEFSLRGFVKSELLDDVQAKAMFQAGFRWILAGFESGSPRILKNMNKRASWEENSRCVEIAHRHGLKVKALMSIGHPGDSAETIEATRKWLIEARPDDIDVTIITPYPGSPYYNRAEPDPARPGIWVYTCKGTSDRLYVEEIDYSRTANYYKGDPAGGYRSYVFTDHLTAEDIVRLRDEVERGVRQELGIPFPPAACKVHFEHSMGQSGPVLVLPPSIFRSNGRMPAGREEPRPETVLTVR